MLNEIEALYQQELRAGTGTTTTTTTTTKPGKPTQKVVIAGLAEQNDARWLAENVHGWTLGGLYNFKPKGQDPYIVKLTNWVDSGFGMEFTEVTLGLPGIVPSVLKVAYNDNEQLARLSVYTRGDVPFVHLKTDLHAIFTQQSKILQEASELAEAFQALSTARLELKTNYNQVRVEHFLHLAWPSLHVHVRFERDAGL